MLRRSAAGLLLGGADTTHGESDHTVHRGSITKQGYGLVRWAAVEAAQRAAKTSP